MPRKLSSVREALARKGVIIKDEDCSKFGLRGRVLVTREAWRRLEDAYGQAFLCRGDWRDPAIEAFHIAAFLLDALVKAARRADDGERSVMFSVEFRPPPRYPRFEEDWRKPSREPVMVIVLEARPSGGGLRVSLA